MKILRLLLKNYIGIMHGLSVDTIEIDFTKGNNTITMFRGGNGSGKSTILGALNPFKSSNDGRDNLILDGCDGLKEIDYEHNGHIYKISHSYPAKGLGQSFIKKDDVELNPNGGVKTCEEIIIKELEITKDYSKIGKIGSNTVHFVDLTNVNRKEYIKTFLDSEEYDTALKIAQDKAKVLRNEVKNIANNLSSCEDKNVLETRLNGLKTDIENAEKIMSDNLPLKGSIEADLRNIETIISNSKTMDELQTIKTNKEAELASYRATKATLETELTDLDKAEEVYEELRAEISTINTNISVNNSLKDAKNELITNSNNKIKGLKDQLSNLGNEEDIKKIETEISNTEIERQNIKEKIQENPVSSLVKKMITEKKPQDIYLAKFKDFTKYILKYFTNLQLKSLDLVHSNIESFLDEQCGNSISRQVKQSRETIDSKRTMLSELERDHSANETHRCQLDSLGKRPRECTIDSCPFISEALKYKNIESVICSQESEIEQLKKDIKILEDKAQDISELSNLYTEFTNQYSNVYPRDNDILAYFLSKKSLVDWVVGPIAEFQKESEELIKNIEEVNYLYGSSLEKQKYIDEKKIVKEKLQNQTTRDLYETNISTEEAQKSKVEEDYKKLEAEGNKLQEQLKEKQDLAEKYSKYIEAIKKDASISTMLSTNKSDIAILSNALEQKEKLTNDYNKVIQEIENAKGVKSTKTTEFNSTSISLSKVNELLKKKATIDKQLNPIESVIKALSPSTGILLVLTKIYLDRTEEITNELLKIAYGDDFKIKFKNEPKAFNIEVNAKGNIKSDIKLASQGEIALTTISISLALIQQSIEAYNILCLDEIDGPLDVSNRENFINILESQIQKLGIEQVFVISHNNAFDTCAMNLVLLKDSDVDKTNTSYMQNKTILFDYENGGQA